MKNLRYLVEKYPNGYEGYALEQGLLDTPDPDVEARIAANFKAVQANAILTINNDEEAYALAPDATPLQNLNQGIYMYPQGDGGRTLTMDQMS